MIDTTLPPPPKPQNRFKQWWKGLRWWKKAGLFLAVFIAGMMTLGILIGPDNDPTEAANQQPTPTATSRPTQTAADPPSAAERRKALDDWIAERREARTPLPERTPAPATGGQCQSQAAQQIRDYLRGYATITVDDAASERADDGRWAVVVDYTAQFESGARVKYRAFLAFTARCSLDTVYEWGLRR